MRSTPRVCVRFLPLLLAGCAFQCEEDTAQAVLKPTLDSRSEAERQTAAELVPVPTGPAVPWQSLESFAPDTIGDYVALGPAEGRALPATGTQGNVEAIKREYEKDGVHFQVEILDALYAPAVRQIVKKMQGSDRSVEGKVLRGTTLRGYPAVESQQANTARAGVLVAGRYIVNIIATPASSTDVATAFAAALALDDLAKVESPAETTPAPALPPTPGAQVAPTP